MMGRGEKEGSEEEKRKEEEGGGEKRREKYRFAVQGASESFECARFVAMQLK